MRHNADDQGRERDRADRQLKNDAQIGAKVPPDGKIGTGEQQRRQKQHQCQVRIELDIRRARNNRKRDAAEDKGRRGRHADAARKQFQAEHDRHQQKDELEPRDYRQDRLTACDEENLDTR